MFRGSEGAGATIPVQISTATGETLHGHITAGVSGKLIDFLNRETGFFEFTGADGPLILSKSAVRSIAVIQQPRVDQLSRRTQRQDQLDPYSILELPRGASAEEVRSAYRQHVRLYHPDNFAGIEVPAEVLEYVTAMFRRLTNAYREICQPADFDRAA